MNLYEMFFHDLPAIKSLFELGYLPKEDEVHEISPELYAVYESKGGDISNRLYTITPKGDNPIPENEINIIPEGDLPKLWKAVNFLRNYAKKAGCTSTNSEDILTTAASIMPDVLSENTRFARKK